ncbi:MAG TPA: hypothetical protein VKU00_08915 [Chthonomonadaceae bacterium]|nr:hypothetical protein [Chthonomonadaceae bacterium]
MSPPANGSPRQPATPSGQAQQVQDTDAIGWTLGHDRQIGTVVAVFCGILCIYYRVKRHRDVFDERLAVPVLSSGLAGYAVVQCSLLLYCAGFDINQLTQLHDYPIYIVLAALAGIIIAVVTIYNFVKKPQ